MPQPEYLHIRPDFGDLIRIVARDMGIDPALVEKDYWIDALPIRFAEARFHVSAQGRDLPLQGLWDYRPLFRGHRYSRSSLRPDGT